MPREHFEALAQQQRVGDQGGIIDAAVSRMPQARSPELPMTSAIRLCCSMGSRRRARSSSSFTARSSAIVAARSLV